MSVYSQISQSLGGYYDAFWRARVSSPVTVFDSQLEYDDQPLLWFTKADGASASDRLPFGLDIDGANAIPLALKVYALENGVSASFPFQWEEVR